MRAARVLDMLLVLQRRGRLTAAQLADALEVSERTVLRDVEALGEAGVPIFTVRGAGGGTTQLSAPPAEFNLTDFWKRHVAATAPIAAG